MDIADHLRRLPNGWRWEGPVEKYTEWLDRDSFLKVPFAVGNVFPPAAEDSTWILHAQYVAQLGVTRKVLVMFFSVLDSRLNPRLGGIEFLGGTSLRPKRQVFEVL